MARDVQSEGIRVRMAVLVLHGRCRNMTAREYLAGDLQRPADLADLRSPSTTHELAAPRVAYNLSRVRTVMRRKRRKMPQK